MGHRRGGDNYRGGRDSGRDRRDDYRERDRDHGRDYGRDRDRDRDPYGRDSRDWRDRRSPPPARGGGGRYSPEPRRRRSYSRSPVRGSDRDRRDYDTNGDRYDITCIDRHSITEYFPRYSRY
jgi:transformer-2 protein